MTAASRSERSRRRDARALAIFLAIVLAGLVLWTHRVNGAMPLIVDEMVLLWQAEHLAQGHLTAPAPAHAEFVNTPLIPIRGERCFGQYPVGFPLALAPWAAAGVPWVLNVGLGIVSLLLMFRFADRVAGRRAAWLSLVLLACSPFFIAQSTVFFMQPLLLALTLVLLVSLEARESAPSRVWVWPLLAGATIGYAWNVSPFAALALVLICADRWVVTRSSARVSRSQALAFLLPVVAGAAAFCGVNAVTTGDALVTPYYYSDSRVRVGFGDTVGNAGHSPERAWFKTKQRVRLLDEFLFGWPGTSFTFVGLYGASRVAAALARARARLAKAGIPDRLAAPLSTATEKRPPPWDHTLVLLFVGTLVIYAFWYFHGNGPSWGPRYLYATLPALVLFTAQGLLIASAWCARLIGARLRSADLIEVLLPFALVAVLAAVGTVPFLLRLKDDPFLRMRRATRDFLERLENEKIETGTIFVRVTGRESLTLQTALMGVSGFSEDGPLVFARNREPEENRRFAATRGSAPAFVLSIPDPDGEWRMEPLENQVSFRPGSSSRAPARKNP